MLMQRSMQKERQPQTKNSSQNRPGVTPGRFYVSMGTLFVMTFRDMADYTIKETKELANSQVEIEGEIPAGNIDAARTQAVKNLAGRVEIEGFRKGKIPENVLVKHVGDMALLEEAANIALQRVYPDIVKEADIKAIGYPEVTITKIAKGEDLGFKIKVPVMPEVTLPDYKKLAKKHTGKKEKTEVTDKEVEETIEQIRKNKAQFDAQHASKEAQEAHAKGEPHEHKEIKDEDLELPEVNTEFVQALGDFKDVDDFKKKLKENIAKEKEQKAAEANRAAILDALLEESKVSLPDMLIESELAKMLGGFKDDIMKAGMKYEDYLKQIEKTEEDIRKEWRPQAEKKAKLQLVFNKIATEEKLDADPKVLEEQSKQLIDMYKDADPERVKAYVEAQLINQEVLKFLESQK